MFKYKNILQSTKKEPLKILENSDIINTNTIKVKQLQDGSFLSGLSSLS